MPKRSRENDEEYIKRKMKKIEKKLRKWKNRSLLCSDSNDQDSGDDTMSPVLTILEDSQPPILLEPAILDELPGTSVQDTDLEVAPGHSTPAPEERPLDEDILQMLGASPSKGKKMGAVIHKDLALRWEHIATTGLSKEVRKELLDKHLTPENRPKVAAPCLNPEIKAALLDTFIGKDKSSETKQNQVASVISCLGETLTKMLHSENRDTSVIRPLLEGAQLLCDLQFKESMKRRSLVCSSIKKDIRTQLYETDIDSYLFGKNLAETLKTAKAITKSGTEIKATKTRAGTSRGLSNNLNFRPQLVYSRQPAKRRQLPAQFTQHPYYQTPYAAMRHQAQLLPPPPPPPPPAPATTAAPPPPPPPALPRAYPRSKPRQQQHR